MGVHKDGILAVKKKKKAEKLAVTCLDPHHLAGLQETVLEHALCDSDFSDP